MAERPTQWPALTVVSGPAGIGKSTYVRALIDPAQSVWVTLRQHRHASELASRVHRHLRTRLPNLPTDLATAVGPSCGPTADADPLGRAEQLGALIGDALSTSLHRDLVLVFDEVERIDAAPSPARMVESLVRTAPSRLRIVVITRTSAPFSVARLRHDGQLGEVGPEQLSVDTATATRVVTDRWPDIDQLLADRLATAARGNAGALNAATALLQRLDTGRRTVALDELASADDMIETSLRQVVALLTPAERTLVEELAVLGEASINDLGDRPEIDQLVAGLSAAALIEPATTSPSSSTARFRLSRPAREIVGAQAEIAAELAGRGLKLAIARGDAAAGLAIVTRYGDTDLLVETLTQLGPSIADSGDAQLVIDAVDALPAERSVEFHGLAGRAAQALGDWQQAVAEYERAAEHEIRASDAWRHGLITYLQGDISGSRMIYRRALEAPTYELADDTCRAMLAGYAGASAWMAGDLEAARTLSGEALTHATNAGLDRALAVAHTTAALVAASDGDRISNDWNYVRALQHAERAGDALQIARIRSNQGSRLLEEGDYHDSLLQLDLAVRHADLGGYGAMLALCLSNRGDVLTKLGRLDEARTDLGASIDMLQTQQSRFLAYPLTALAQLFVVRGDIEQARGACEQALALAESTVDRQVGVAVRVQLARALAQRDPDSAWEHAQAAVESTSSLHLAEAWSVVARLAHDRGDSATARDAVKQATELARSRRDRWALAHALEIDALTTGEAGDRRVRLEEAEGLFDELGCPIDAARVALALCVGDPTSRAVPRIVAIADLARRLGARPLVAAADEAIARIDSDVPVSLAVAALGPFGVIRDGTPIPTAAWQSKKARDLFRMLVTRRGRPLPREQAIERLWPDDDVDKVSSKLSVALATIRSVLDPDKEFGSDHFISADTDSIRLVMDSVSIDVEQFLDTADSALQEHRLGGGDTATTMLAAAEAAYTGDVFEDDPYSDWHVPLREDARSVYLAVTTALAERRADAGDRDDAIRLLLRVVEREPYDEAAHLRIVGLLTQVGRHGDARRRYRYYADRMRELDLEPRSFPGVGQIRPG